MVKAGMSKADLLAEHGHVLGLQDINVDMKERDYRHQGLRFANQPDPTPEPADRAYRG